jgi:anti-sigma28 factor (negative regulator of flagellin synthesis)
MQISGLSSSPSLPVERTNTPLTAKAASDQAVLNVSPDSFSRLVQEAGSMPEVRNEVVDAFKARIQSGQYPPQEVVAGLVDVIGGGIVQAAKAGSSS